MSDKNRTSNKGIVAGIVAAGAILQNVEPIVKVVRDLAEKKLEERKKLITVPELYCSEYDLNINQAEEIVNNCGLKAMPVSAKIDIADPKYRTCSDLQVIKSEPKAKKKVEPGTTIKIIYITQDIINESQRLFEELENQKEQKNLEKVEKKLQHKQKMTQAASNTANKVKEKIPHMLHKKE